MASTTLDLTLDDDEDVLDGMQIELPSLAQALAAAEEDENASPHTIAKLWPIQLPSTSSTFTDVSLFLNRVMAAALQQGFKIHQRKPTANSDPSFVTLVCSHQQCSWYIIARTYEDSRVVIHKLSHAHNSADGHTHAMGNKIVPGIYGRDELPLRRVRDPLVAPSKKKRKVEAAASSASKGKGKAIEEDVDQLASDAESNAAETEDPDAWSAISVAKAKARELQAAGPTDMPAIGDTFATFDTFRIATLATGLRQGFTVSVTGTRTPTRVKLCCSATLGQRKNKEPLCPFSITATKRSGDAFVTVSELKDAHNHDLHPEASATQQPAKPVPADQPKEIVQQPLQPKTSAVAKQLPRPNTNADVAACDDDGLPRQFSLWTSRDAFLLVARSALSDPAGQIYDVRSGRVSERSEWFNYGCLGLGMRTGKHGDVCSFVFKIFTTGMPIGDAALQVTERVVEHSHACPYAGGSAPLGAPSVKKRKRVPTPPPASPSVSTAGPSSSRHARASPFVVTPSHAPSPSVGPPSAYDYAMRPRANWHRPHYDLPHRKKSRNESWDIQLAAILTAIVPSHSRLGSHAPAFESCGVSSTENWMLLVAGEAWKDERFLDGLKRAGVPPLEIMLFKVHMGKLTKTFGGE